MALSMKPTRIICRRLLTCVKSCKVYLSHDKTVRVRFAPSPTGMMHLGGLRTALFNYLFAKSNRGKFVLRIEDTDLTRIVPGAIEKIEEDLQWAGLVPDESPSNGGLFGPYKQSERLQLYSENVDTLLKSGHCYKCFCTERRLNLLRKDMAKRGEPPRYDNKCRYLTAEEIQEKIENNIPYVIRFKYEPLESAWTDLVYGRMHEKFLGESIEGDFVVIKTDGYPTYHFANVVDDHYMKISHVLRGQEWSISTPKHLQMYKAFGWEPPLYAHLPLILNGDGTKLSKRQGDIKVEAFQGRYDPNAVLNYLTTVGSGFTEETDGKTLTEMINLFSVSSIVTHSSRLQPEKLTQLNRRHLYRRFHSESKQQVITETQDMIKKHYGDRINSSHVLQSDYIEKILHWGLEHRIFILDDLLSEHLQFIWVVPDPQTVKLELSKHKHCKQLIKDTIVKLEQTQTFDEPVVKEVLMCYCREQDLKTKQYMTVLRKCLGEQKEGPPVSEMMASLGKNETLSRLETAVNSVMLINEINR